jgi:DNA-binding beta-propeller fold protein YncE
MMRALRGCLAVVSVTLVFAAPAQLAFSQSSAPTPAFQVDPFWPKQLPNNWMLGNVVGVSIDSKDNIWITHRPNSYQYAASTPPVLVFNPAGDLLRSMGGPGPGYQWGTQVHGIYVDYKGNVWIGFGGGLPYDPKKAHTTDNAHVIKFSPEGKFLLQVGQFGKGTEGSNSTRYLGNPTDVYVDPQTDEAYISDGYINHRVIVVDANTGAYKRHWGAYGKRPDDAMIPPQGTTPPQARDLSAAPPQQFETPHCVKMAKDGLLYVCDRQNTRIQVFKKDGTFVKEAFIKAVTDEGALPARPGDIAFSRDPDQRLLYVVDMMNAKVLTLRRDTLETISTFGHRGRNAGQLLSPHSLAVDSKGGLIVTETTDGSRLQKFVMKGKTQAAGGAAPQLLDRGLRGWLDVTPAPFQADGDQ